MLVRIPSVFYIFNKTLQSLSKTFLTLVAIFLYFCLPRLFNAVILFVIIVITETTDDCNRIVSVFIQYFQYSVVFIESLPIVHCLLVHVTYIRTIIKS